MCLAPLSNIYSSDRVQATQLSKGENELPTTTLIINIISSVIVSKKRYADMAYQEMQFLKTVRDKEQENQNGKKIVQLYDDFTLEGVNGSHCVMVFETLGPNLDKWLLKVVTQTL